MRTFIQRGSVTFEVDLDHVKLRSLHVQMDPFDRLRAGGIMDVWMSGQCVYAVILADSEDSTVGKSTTKPTKSRHALAAF